MPNYTLSGEYSTRYDMSEFCNSVIEYTDSDGNLSEPDVCKLLSDHGVSYHEYATDCGHDYHANSVLTWLGY